MADTIKVKMKVTCDHSVRLTAEDAEKLGRASVSIKLLKDQSYDLPVAEVEKLVGFGYAEKV